MPRQEFVDPALLAAVDDGGESGGQIGKRIDGVELSGFDERAIVALFSAPTSCPAKKERSCRKHIGAGGPRKQRTLRLGPKLITGGIVSKQAGTTWAQ